MGPTDGKGCGWGPIRAEIGDITNEPAGNGLNPHVSKEDLAAHSGFPTSDSGWDANRDKQRAGLPGSPPAPGRTGPPPEAPSPRRRKVSGQNECGRGDQASAGKRRAAEPEAGVMVSLTDKDIAHAGKRPSWSGQGIMFSVLWERRRSS